MRLDNGNIEAIYREKPGIINPTPLIDPNTTHLFNFTFFLLVF
jgi:hypothetical protein